MNSQLIKLFYDMANKIVGGKVLARPYPVLTNAFP